MQQIRQQIWAVCARQQSQWTWRCVSWGLIAGGIIGCLIAGAWWLGVVSGVALPLFAFALLGGPFLGFCYSWIFARSLQAAADEIDRSYQFKDRAATALAFMSRGYVSPVQELQIEDARKHLAEVDPVRVVPDRVIRPFPVGLALSALAIGMMWLAQPAQQIQASLTVNDVVLDQAARLTEELQKIEEFNQSQPSPEIEKLLKELAAKVEELRQPGVDPREAMAKLSEMQASLEAQQQALQSLEVDAALRETGKALTLAAPYQEAGQALANGDFDKAADQLEKQELAKLNEETQKALMEKLEKLQSGQSRDGSRRNLEQALGNMAQGLSQGNKSRFNEGSQGLAGEARKQSRRNKLADLLRKQCQCLSECKGECEGECKNPGEGSKKGGHKAGLARSGNEAGEKTPLLKTSKEMKLTGQESAQGDVDTETSDAPEQQQQAIRSYQEKVEKYQRLSESAIDAEPIPLGHRQTIRRYFDLIRPQSGETDKVFESDK